VKKFHDRKAPAAGKSDGLGCGTVAASLPRGPEVDAQEAPGVTRMADTCYQSGRSAIAARGQSLFPSADKTSIRPGARTSDM
jgi:hypothetical protein